jgi:hypothetical protein
MPLAPNSGVLVRPNTTTPAFSQRATISLCTGATNFAAFSALQP